MPSYVPCKKNDSNGYIFYVSLVSQADTKIMKVSPTLAAGDVQIAIDDGAPNNLGTLPVVDADFTKRVKVTLSQAETNGDNLTIIFQDAAGSEWCDLTINIQTSAQTLDTIGTNVVAVEAKTNLIGASVALEAGGNLATAVADIAAVHVHVGTIDGHITADYGATEKTCVDLLDDAAGGLADIHTDVGTVAGYVDKIDDATDGLTAIKAEVEGLGGAAMRGTDNAALASVCTEARLAELGATNIPADIDAIKAKTDLLPADTATQLDTNIPAIKAKTDLLPADTAMQLDTNIPTIKAKTDLIPADIATQIDTNVPAIKAKTDNLPSDPADESLLEAGLSAIYNSVALGALETTAQDIKAKTDNLPPDPADESLLEAAIASAGTAPQVIRDAMKLAPSVGVPAAGSVDKHLDDIESKESFKI